MSASASASKRSRQCRADADSVAPFEAENLGPHQLCQNVVIQNGVVTCGNYAVTTEHWVAGMASSLWSWQGQCHGTFIKRVEELRETDGFGDQLKL